jgi:magnesium transporter
MAISPKNTEEIKLNLKKITSNGLTWVDIVQPTDEVKKYLTDNYHFNPLDIEDCLSTRQLSKVEEYPDYLFVIFHLPVYEKARRISIRKQWSAFVCDNLLITLRPGELRVVDDLLHQCEINEEVRQEYLSHGSAYLLYRILDTALDAYFPVMEKISSMTWKTMSSKKKSRLPDS